MSTVPTATLIKAVHRGLYDAWLFAFRAYDSPSASPKPEYVATVLVGQRIVDDVFKGISKVSLTLEENVQRIASRCFADPLFPRVKRRLPSRKIGSKGERERVDIAIQDDSVMGGPVRAVIELKISAAVGGLRADLLRNQLLMEQTHTTKVNQLQVAQLGFVVVDDRSIGSLAGQSFETRLAKRYADLASKYVSASYTVNVSVETLQSVPGPEDEEFRHMVSVVITFFRSSTYGPGRLEFVAP